MITSSSRCSLPHCSPSQHDGASPTKQIADLPITMFSAPLIIPVTAPVIIDGAVAVQGSTILHVGTRRWVLDTIRDEMPLGTIVNEHHWNGTITPGLVNAHTHLQYTGMAQVGQRHYDRFRAWELAFNSAYAEASATNHWQSWARQGAESMVQYGTTAAADVVTDPSAVYALQDVGMHGIAYWEVMGWHNDDWRSDGKQGVIDQINAIASQRNIRLGISPHAPYTLESQPFVDLPDIARHMGLRLHVHLGETPLEAGDESSMLSTYSTSVWRDQAWANYRALKEAETGASAIQFLDQLGSLGPDVHIAHGVYANAEDRRILRQRGVSVALCPRSNRITATLRDAPVKDYLQEGNLVAVGTDSLGSSPTLNVLDDVALLYDLAREQGYGTDDLSHRLIRMMTLGGAEAMGLNTGHDRIGQINTGATADLAFFDIPTRVRTPTDIETTLEALVRFGAGTNRATVVSGRLAFNQSAFDLTDGQMPISPTAVPLP